MTQIKDNIELDYCDVLFKPKRTTLNSRSEADVYREYKFKYGFRNLVSCGIMAANMATTGTFEMARVLQKNKMICCLQKHYSYEELYDFLTENNFNAKTFDDKLCGNQYIFITSGIKDEDYEKVTKILDTKLCSNLCIDIANGYIPKLLDYVKKVRNKYPDITIMVGNVVTGDMTQDLILNGADIVKVGIGPGCFTPNMKVKTNVGLKNIKDIQIGDNVLTHKNQYQKVTNKFEYNEFNKIISINGIESTKHHEYYVVNKKYKDIITDENIHDYAEWVSADKLTKDYYLLKSTI